MTRQLAVILGSGMGSLANEMVVRRVVRFADIEGVGACTVAGHAGEVRVGSLGGRECLLVLGRRHFYEGAAGAMEGLVAWLAARGATHLLVTSAAGAIRASLFPGEIVVARDVIDRQNRPAIQHLRGAARAAAPVRAPLHVDSALTSALERAATTAGVPWQRGTLVCGSGPGYETVAEVRSLQEAGADVATMSAAPEVAAANAAGIPVAVAALVTNPGTGIGPSVLSHDEVLEVGRRWTGRVGRMVRQLALEL